MQARTRPALSSTHIVVILQHQNISNYSVIGRLKWAKSRLFSKIACGKTVTLKTFFHENTPYAAILTDIMAVTARPHKLLQLIWCSHMIGDTLGWAKYVRDGRRMMSSVMSFVKWQCVSIWTYQWPIIGRLTAHIAPRPFIGIILHIWGLLGITYIPRTNLHYGPVRGYEWLQSPLSVKKLPFPQ